MGIFLCRSSLGSSDTTPNAFTFTDQTNVGLSSTITSAAITVAGINAAATITVTGGTYDINASGSFTSSAGTVNNGDTVRARHTSSGSNSTATNTVVTIGGVSDTFTSTTEASSSVLFFYDFSSGSTHSEGGVELLAPTNADGVVDISSFPSPQGSTEALRFNADSGLPELRWEIDAPGYSELWIEYAMYWPDGTEGFGPAFNLIQDAVNHHFKQIRVGDGATHAEDSEMRFGASMSSDETMFIEYGGPGDPDDFWISPGPPPVDGGTCNMPPALGEWVVLKWHFKSPTVTPTDWGNSTGIIQLYIDGVLTIDIDEASQSTANRAIRNGYFFGAQTQCHCATGSHFLITDITFSTSDPSP